MQTLMLTPCDDDIALAGEILKKGGLVAIPTETVYGLAANALDPAAVANIFVAKGRPQDNPLIVHISRLEQLGPLVSEIPESALALAERYWPGPLTMIMPVSDRVPKVVTAGLDTVAVRFPSHDTARRLIDSAGVPLAAPSANLSGKPSPTAASHVMHDMNGRIDAVVDGGECSFGVESTVITLCEKKPRLLRPGAVTPEMLRDVLGDIEIDHAVLEMMAEGETAASPGMKYKHYSPDADVVLVLGSFEQYREFFKKNADVGTYAMCFTGEGDILGVPHVEYGSEDDLLSQMKGVFGALRLLDYVGAKRAFVRCCEPKGVGLAVYNRLLRSAGFNVVDVRKAAGVK